MADTIKIGENPLSEDDLVKINNGLIYAREGLRQIDLAKMAGLDVTAQEQQLRDYESKLLSPKQVYFPGR